MPRSCLALAVLLVVLGCAKEDAPEKAQATSPTKPAPAAGDAKADAAAATPTMGRVTAGPLPIADMLGHTPAEVEALLGDPLGKGEMRESCVRFVPDRTWFRCKHARQRYADPTGKFEAVGVEYEDGKASALAFELPQLDGTFDPKRALAYVGLELPDEPKLDEPAADTKVYSWFNSAARLRVHGRQYRVQASTVAGDWGRSKVEVILNDPLSADEQARKLERGTTTATSSAGAN